MEYSENYACYLQPYQSSTELKTTVENQKLKGANEKRQRLECVKRCVCIEQQHFGVI